MCLIFCFMRIGLHIQRRRLFGFPHGNCAVLQGSAVPYTQQTYRVKLLRKRKACIYLTNEHMLSSSDTAFQIVNGAYEKMLIEFAIDEYIHIVELRLTFSDNNSVTYEYSVDHNKDWGEIHYTFGEDDYDVIRYVYADKKGDFFFAYSGEWIMQNTNRKHTPKDMVISL